MTAESTHQSLFPNGVPDGCKILYLEDICQGIFDCPHSTPKLADEGPYLVRTQDIRGGYFDTENAVRVSWESYHDRIKRARPSAGDILFSREGTYFGDAAEVPEGTPVCLGQRMVLIRPYEGVNSTFLRIWINSQRFQDYLKRYRDGTVAERINVSAIRKLPVLLPEPSHQEYVVQNVAAIESKIHLNREINQTLEQMAQAIFNSWLVDFEPVKAKIAALEAGGSEEDALVAAMQAISGKDEAELTRLKAEQPEQYVELRATAELFPSAMQDSELGEIPEGWSVSQIGDEVTVVGGGTPSTKNPDFWENGEISWTSPKDLSNLSDKVLIETERKVTEAGLAKISSGLLPVDTVLMSSRAPVGYLALAKIPVAVNQGYIAMKCERALSPEFVIQWCASHMGEIKSRASGTTFAEISKKNFKIIPVVMPPESLIAVYSKQVSSLYDTIENNVRESNNLAKLRDSLLPKLLSGELSVPGAEGQPAEAMETANV